jgi:hypothetical protein
MAALLPANVQRHAVSVAEAGQDAVDLADAFHSTSLLLINTPTIIVCYLWISDYLAVSDPVIVVPNAINKSSHCHQPAQTRTNFSPENVEHYQLASPIYQRWGWIRSTTFQ